MTGANEIDRGTIAIWDGNLGKSSKLAIIVDPSGIIPEVDIGLEIANGDIQMPEEIL